jgi:hypothetical protein
MSAAPTINDVPVGPALAGACLAHYYHGGQRTALYSLASTGSLEHRRGEGLARIRREVSEACAAAERLGDLRDADHWRAFGEWLAASDAE